MVKKYGENPGEKPVQLLFNFLRSIKLPVGKQRRDGFAGGKRKKLARVDRGVVPLAWAQRLARI